MESILEKIKAHTGNEDEVLEDWHICTFYASDNLVHRSLQRWTISVLEQMLKVPNIHLLINHDWEDIESVKGFCIDAYAVKSSTIPATVNQVPNRLKENAEIVAKEGYMVVYLVAAIPKTDSELVKRLSKTKIINNCSTGGFLRNTKWLCPHCNVGFFDFDERSQDFLCQHLVPDLNESNPMQAPYVTLDGIYEPIELSIVVSGDLPAAQIM